MKFGQWLLYCGAAGGFIALVLFLEGTLRGIFGLPAALVLVLWPAAIMLMALECPECKGIIPVVTVAGISIMTNILLYSVVAVVAWPLARFLFSAGRAPRRKA